MSSRPCCLLLSPAASCCRRYTTQLVARLDSLGRVKAGLGKALYTALLVGLPVVDIAWLEDSLQQGQLLPTDDYLAKVCVCVCERCDSSSILIDLAELNMPPSYPCASTAARVASTEHCAVLLVATTCCTILRLSTCRA